MLGLHHKRRWVFSPVDDRGRPLVSSYAVSWDTVLPHNGYALVCCVFDAHGLIAARACPHLRVLPSLHANESIPDVVATHYAGHGLQPGMKMPGALTVLAKHHPSFEPEV